jgi:hypothetical protein
MFKNSFKLLFGNIKIQFVQPFELEININEVIQTVENRLSKFRNILVDTVDEIMIGKFKFLVEKNIESSYTDGVIYLTTDIDNANKISDCIIHECGHAIEEHRSDFIYEDGLIQDEFLKKRKKLYSKLVKRFPNLDYNLFIDIDYNEVFDELMFVKIGYDVLNDVGEGLFISPYAVTSCREYFATGFEEYVNSLSYFAGTEKLEKISPELYTKLMTLDGVTENSEIMNEIYASRLKGDR